MRQTGGSPVRPIRRTRRTWLPVALCGLLAFATACQAWPGSDGGTAGPNGKPSPQARIQVQPADGTDGVSPSRDVTLNVTDGQLKRVRVRAKSTDNEDQKPGVRISGKRGADGSRWVSTEPLLPGAIYTVRATAVDENGLTTSVADTFSTVKPDDVLHASISPLDTETVGVGMPINLYLSNPVPDKFKARVEKRLKLEMSEPVTGAWHWMDDETLSFRPKEYWPVGEHVTLRTNWIGVHAGRGLWGDQSREISFDVGDRHVSVVDADAHAITVKSGGDVVRTFPISAGNSDHPSSSGILLAKAKEEHITMDSSSYGVPVDSPEGYSVETEWNVRITDSGQFVHGAPWSVGAQGERNVSHGCVNMSVGNAKWFYDFTQRGDIVKVTGTSRDVEWRNGWTQWNMSWDDWVEGSALDHPVVNPNA